MLPDLQAGFQERSLIVAQVFAHGWRSSCKYRRICALLRRREGGVAYEQEEVLDEKVVLSCVRFVALYRSQRIRSAPT